MYLVSLTVKSAEVPDTKTKVDYITVYQAPAPPPPPSDSDGDGVIDTEDNCISVPNPDQAGSDMDGIGDSCDIDNLQSAIQELNDLVIELNQQNDCLSGHCNRVVL